MSIQQTVVINTDTKSLADLRKEISDIQRQLDLTPTGTKEYDDLVVRLRQAKGEIKDFKEATKGLDPDQRAAKLVNAFQGMTGAIQSAAGAVTLFGGSSESLEKVEKNLLGIIAIGGGIQSTIEGYNDAVDVIGPKLKNLGSTITNAFTTGTASARAFNVALAGLGIGVVVLAVNQLSKAFEDNKKAQEDAAKEAELSLKRIDNAERKKLNNIIANNKKQLRDDLETARKRGASELELVDIKLKSQQKLTDELDKFRNESNTQTSAFIDEQNKLALESADQEIEITNEKNEVIRRQDAKAAEELKQLIKDRNDFILSLEEDLLQSVAALNKSKATTEKEQVDADFQAEIADLERQRVAKVAEAEKLGLDILKVNEVYDNLNEAARNNYSKTIKAIDKKTNDDRLAELLKSEEKINQSFQRQLNNLKDYNQQVLNELDFVYDEVLEQFKNITRDQFQGTTVLIGEQLPRIKNALQKQENIFGEYYKKVNQEQLNANKKRLKQTLDVLQQEQLAVDDDFNRRIKLAIETEGVFSETVTNLRDEQLKAFQAYQTKKKQILEQGAKDEIAINEDLVKKNYEFTQFILDSTATLSNTLATFSDAAASRRVNAINDQIEAELKLAKARGASQEELEKITEAGNARLEAEAERTFKIQQQYAIAAALIDGSSAVLRIFSNAAANPKSILFPAQPYIEAALATAFTLAKINQIKSTSVSSTGGGFGSVGGTSGGGGGIVNPFSSGGFGGGGTNILPPRLAPPSGGGTKADTTGQFEQGAVTTPVVRAYVLAGDVTDAQTAEARLNQKRKL